MSERKDLRFLLLQARRPGDRVRGEEQQAFAGRLGVELDQVQGVDIFHDELDVEYAREFSAVLVGGAGEYGVLDGHPRVDAMIKHLVALSEIGHPVFASCFGFQALVVGLGGAVITDEAAAEVGTYVLTADPQVDDDPVFSILPPEFNAQLGHKDRASVLPSCAHNFASSALCPYQAIRISGTPVYATQFHPELTWSDNRTRFERYMPQYGRLFGAEEAQRKLDSHKPSPESNQLLSRFVDCVLLGADQ